MPLWVPLLSAAIGAALGWALGQGAEMIRQKRRLKRYYDVIYTELRDAHSALKTRALALHQAMGTFLETGAISYFPTRIDHFIFSARFADCALEFTESERLSLTHIYEHIDSLNWQFSQMRDDWDFLSGNRDEDREKKRRIVQLMEGAYMNACETDAMIELSLSNRAKFDIRALEAEEHITKATIRAEAEVRKLVETAKRRRE